MSGPPDTRRGYDAREVVSALQKAIRRSDLDAALYWGVELARSGYGNWLWARLRIIVAEDCSPEATGLVGDVHAPSVREVASALTPVPGGVGPLTIALLMKNTVKAAGLRA